MAAELDVWKALIRVSQILPRELDADLARRGAGLAHYEILAVLAEHRDGLRMTELGHWAQVSKPRLSVHVRQLDERGLVARRADPVDGRAVIVAITAAGRREVRRLTVPHVDLAHRAVLDHLGPGDGEVLLRVLSAVLRALGDTWEPDGAPLPPPAGRGADAG